MKKKTKMAFVGAGTGLALVVGGIGVAAASGNGANGRGPFGSVLSKLVGNGTITQAQADTIVQEANTQRQAEIAAHAADRTAHHNLIASTIGSDWTTISKRLQAGESLASIAGSKKDALITALVNEASGTIDKAVTDGRLTAEQASTIKANLQSQITSFVNGTGHMGRALGGMMGGLGGPDGDYGMMGGLGGPDGDYGMMGGLGGPDGYYGMMGGLGGPGADTGLGMGSHHGSGGSNSMMDGFGSVGNSATSTNNA